MRASVCIVGAGPAGLVLAHLLGRAGIPYLLLERSAPADLPGAPKAGMLEYRTVQLLRQEGLTGDVLAIGTENHRCEFRTPDESVVLDYGTLTGGRPHYVYPQHQLVHRLYETLPGAHLRCDHRVTTVHSGPDGVRLAGATSAGEPFTVDCAVAVGCDGSRSAVAAAMPGVRASEQRFPVRWLAVIAQAPPLVGHTVYAAHPHGFAGHMRRSPDRTRYYLEVPAEDGPARWPADRIRAELTTRLLAGHRLDGVTFEEPTFLDLRTRVTEPMQVGRLYLAGDAAHLITPAGGKGMNLAIQDAVELAHGLIDRFGPAGSDTRLAAYSARRRTPIWRAQAFSDWFLHIILASPRAGATAFAAGLRDGWLAALHHDPLLVRWFAHAYAGVDPHP